VKAKMAKDNAFPTIPIALTIDIYTKNPVSISGPEENAFET
jgi:hypothetical protein